MKGVVLHQDNARPYTSLVTRQAFTASIRSNTTPIIFSRHDTFDYYLLRSLFSTVNVLLQRKSKIIWNFAIKDLWSHYIARKMEKGVGLEWTTHILEIYLFTI